MSRTSPGPETWAALMTRAPVRRATSTQYRGALVAVQLQQRQPELVAELRRDVLQGRVDEHPAQLDAAAQRGADHGGLLERAAAGTALVEDHADRPGAELGGQLGVGKAA